MFHPLTARLAPTLSLAVLASVTLAAQQLPGRGAADDPRPFGVRGDGRVAEDCRMEAGSRTLTCTADRFERADVGKVIAVYDAGPVANGFVTTLSTAIARFVSPTSVELVARAATTADPSSRAVWGTDDTKALQTALDALARPDASGRGRGGVLDLPSGRFLVSGLDLPCARVGSFRAGACTATYDHIWIRGAGRLATTIENWNAASPFRAVLNLGERAEIPTEEPGNDRLTGITISDLTLWQLKNPERPLATLWSYATTDVTITNTTGVGYSYECYIMGGGLRSIRWQVHDNVMGPCGRGGPTYPTSMSALNLNGSDWVASRNLIEGSPQGVEMGSRRGVLVDNVIVGTGVDGSPKIGVNVGSTGVGIWDNLIARNRIVDFSNGISVGNTLGIARTTEIVDNLFVNASVDVTSGLEANAVNEGEVDTLIHGTSVIRGNTFRFTGRPSLMAIQIGELNNPQAGLENVIVADNRVIFEQTYFDGGPHDRQACVGDSPQATCRIPTGFLALAGPYGGGARWRPGATYAATTPVVPSADNGRYYRAQSEGTSGSAEPVFPLDTDGVVADGTIRWRHAGRRPVVTVTNNTLVGPAGAKGSARDIDLQNGTERRVLRIAGLTGTYDLRIQEQGVDDPANEVVPAMVTYGDRARYSQGRPVVGVFDAGARVSGLGTDGVPTGEAWTVTRGGRAAPAWSAGARFGTGWFVVPPADNGHVYLQTAPACSSGAAAPQWPTGTFRSVTDGTCVWREAGPAARFEP